MRAERSTLPPGDGDLRWSPLLSGEDARDGWRIVEARSARGAPFALRLGWSSAQASGGQAWVCAPHATRVCVFARSLRVEAANRAEPENRVSVTVADGFALTANQWEEHAVTDPVAALAVPPFATHLWVGVDQPDLRPYTVLRLLDGMGTVRESLRLDALPPGGLPLGATHRVEVQADDPVHLRATFTLAL
ncbi:MAG: hypothetical protein H6739_34670 [Alphaproteobacteria bacterium]|nr:hypothetical protein [Alphaproteobacteria bacterium]